MKSEKDTNENNAGDSNTEDGENDGIMQKFERDDLVLARWRDGRGFVAKVMKVDEPGLRLYVRYEDDTKSWTDVKDVRTDFSSWDIKKCCQCLLRQPKFQKLPEADQVAYEESKSEQKMFTCNDCGWNFHETCHSPELTLEFIEICGGVSKFVCRTCSSMGIAKTIREEVESIPIDKNLGVRICEPVIIKRDVWFKQYETLFRVFEASKRILPYSFKDLSWNDHHSINEQNMYCYCGGPGKWSEQMFQCGGCRQWFHENCVRASVLINAKAANREPVVVPDLENFKFDTWHAYTCARCSADGLDAIERVPINWLELLIICFLNISGGKPKTSLKNVIVPWLKTNVRNFVLAKGQSAVPSDDNEWLELVKKIVESAPTRFISSFHNSQPSSKTLSPQPAQNSADPWCQMKTKSILPRRLPVPKSDKKRNKKQDEDVDGKRSRPKKHGLSGQEGSGDVVLKKMAGVAQILTTGVNPLRQPDLPEVNTAPFRRLMPALHGNKTKPLGIHIPYNYDKFGNLVHAIRYGSVSPALSSSSVSPSTSPNLTGAKKRKAYRPLRSATTPGESRSSAGSDGISTISSVSPIAMFTG